MVRVASIRISWEIFSQAKLLAKIEGLTCAEDWIEATLKAELDKRPEIADLVKMQENAKKQTIKEWETKYAKTNMGDEESAV